jgi:hypothetical protein
MPAGPARDLERVLTELVVELADTKFAAHPRIVTEWGRDRPFSTEDRAILYAAIRCVAVNRIGQRNVAWTMSRTQFPVQSIIKSPNGISSKVATHSAFYRLKSLVKGQDVELGHLPGLEEHVRIRIEAEFCQPVPHSVSKGLKRFASDNWRRGRSIKVYKLCGIDMVASGLKIARHFSNQCADGYGWKS